LAGAEGTAPGAPGDAGTGTGARESFFPATGAGPAPPAVGAIPPVFHKTRKINAAAHGKNRAKAAVRRVIVESMKIYPEKAS
jgi:hypothetical protein